MCVAIRVRNKSARCNMCQVDGEHVDQSASRNALTDDDYARLDKIIANRAAFGGWLPVHAFLAAELAEHGHRLIPPMSRGGHTKIVLADGRELSLTELMDRTRSHMLADAHCAHCGNPLPVTLHAAADEVERGRRLDRGEDRRRGTRIDRRYCSNACRQRAYRERRKGDTP